MGGVLDTQRVERKKRKQREFEDSFRWSSGKRIPPGRKTTDREKGYSEKQTLGVPPKSGGF